MYVCVLLGSGGVFFGVRPVAVINKIKYMGLENKKKITLGLETKTY
jgi:hypothetical protein